jgi:hypothetical protein
MTVSGKPFTLRATCSTLTATKKAFAYLSLEDRCNAVGKDAANQLIVHNMKVADEVYNRDLEKWEEYDVPAEDIKLEIVFHPIALLIDRD